MTLRNAKEVKLWLVLDLGDLGFGPFFARDGRRGGGRRGGGAAVRKTGDDENASKVKYMYVAGRWAESGSDCDWTVG